MSEVVDPAKEKNFFETRVIEYQTVARWPWIDRFHIVEILVRVVEQG
jgi:hypothetical protein